MKKIIVPTDFSVQAGHATEMAAQLAKLHGASIHLVHSADVPANWQEGQFTSAVLATKPPKAQQDLYPEARAAVGQARHKLEQLVKELGRRKIESTYEVAPNAAWRDITRLTTKLKADLIVMGTRGAGALKEAFIGSNTQRVVRMADRPVLTLHQTPPSKIANIAVLVDPLDAGLVKDLPKLFVPLAGIKAKYHLLFVNTPGFFQDTDTSLEQLRAAARKLEPEVTVNVTDHFSVAEGAVAFARRAGMDLIALPTHGRQGLRGMLTASMAETVANHSPVPVLTLRMG